MKRRVHFVGIGGAGLSPIARVLHERGEIVTGSDRSRSEYAQALEKLGIQIAYAHDEGNVQGADVVIASSAIPDDNPELVAARGQGIPVMHRKEFLPELTAGAQVIAVAGTHGKTTTSGLISWLLLQAGCEPTFIVGGMMRDVGTNARAGAGPQFVIEADEYDYAFLGLHPSIAVITNVEHDHPDCFPHFDQVQQAFKAFVAQVRDLLVLCLDDPVASRLGRPGLETRTYGLDADADWRAEQVKPNARGGMDFQVLQVGKLVGAMSTCLPGRHNVRNVLAALAVGEALGLPFEESRAAAAAFHGVGRRFEVLGQAKGVVVIDDYAHHPTEIRSTLEAARLRYPQGDIWAVFQPHTYSRTLALLPCLDTAFASADHVIVLDIFAAREKADPRIDGRRVTETIAHPEARFIGSKEEAAQFLLGRVKSGAVVITLSAGDGNRVGEMLLHGLREQAGGADAGR
jgi:UDP-N-acetylmuramate--alanine ligase